MTHGCCVADVVDSESGLKWGFAESFPPEEDIQSIVQMAIENVT